MVFKDYSLGLDKTTKNTIPSATVMTAPDLLKKAIDRLEFRY